MLLDAYPTTFTAVQIHLRDDYTTAWGDDRGALFYDEQGTPEAWFDGLLEAAGNYDDIGQQYAWYEQLYTTRHALPTDVTIDVAGEPVADQVCQIRADVCMEAGGASKPLDVYVVQVLDHWPSSDTPALSHLRIRRIIRGSAMRCCTNFTNHS